MTNLNTVNNTQVHIGYSQSEDGKGYTIGAYDAIDCVDAMIDRVKMELDPYNPKHHVLIKQLASTQFYVRNKLLETFTKASGQSFDPVMHRNSTRHKYERKLRWINHQIIQYFHTWIYKEKGGYYDR